MREEQGTAFHFPYPDNLKRQNFEIIINPYMWCKICFGGLFNPFRNTTLCKILTVGTPILNKTFESNMQFGSEVGLAHFYVRFAVNLIKLNYFLSLFHVLLSLAHAVIQVSAALSALSQ